MKTLFDELKETRELIEVFSPQDFKKGLMWYSVKALEKNLIFNSNKEGYNMDEEDDIKQLKELGISLSNTQVGKSNFSITGINRFLNNDQVEFLDVVSRIEYLLERFIFLRNKNFYTYIALWIVGTYFYRIFRYYPYIHVNAEKGSGKTTLMDIMRLLAFNAEMVNTISGAGIFRLIEATGATLFIDEFENMDKPLYKDLLSILNSGFNINGAVARCEKRNDNFTAPRIFRTYSPKVFASIADIYDVLADRCVKINMLRMTRGEQLERFKFDEDLSKKIHQLQDDLYLLGFNHGAEIAEIYNNNLISDLVDEKLQGRELDIWEGILVLAMQVGDDTFSKMEELALEVMKARTQDSIYKNLTFRLIVALEQVLQHIRPLKINDKVRYYKKNELFISLLKVDPGLKNYIGTVTKLTQYMDNKLAINSDSIYKQGTTERVYIFNDNTITDLKERFNIPEQEELDY